jgi:hypothetical protein
MRRNLLVSGVAFAIVLPSAALAQTTCEERSANRTAGTVMGAAAGALLGSAVASHGDKTTGAVIGGVAGAVVGNQVARGPRDCAHAYGWYDNDGRWHRNAVGSQTSYGYYDQNGAWVDGVPPDYHPAQYSSAPPAVRDWDDDRYDDEWRGSRGYPEFRDQEQRIRLTVRDSVREDMILPDDARDLMDQLREIRRLEARDFQTFGWRLPWHERREIQSRLNGLERRIDEIRNEP